MSGGARNGARKPDLDAARKALLQKRLRGRAVNDERPASIPPLEEGHPVRASYAQSRLWFLDRLFDATPAYHMYRALRLRGTVDFEAIRVALQNLIDRHTTLRTALTSREGELFQEVVEDCIALCRREDLRASPDELDSRLQAEVRQPFNLSKPPLIRAALFDLADDEHVLLLTIHHVASDEWSNGILFEEFAQGYAACISGEQPEFADAGVSYAAYSEWQRERVESVRDEQLEYWRTRLAGELPELDLPLDRGRPPHPGLRGKLLTREISGSVTTAIDELARTAGVTPFVFLLTVFKVLLHRYTGQDDILVGVPAANRAAPQLERVVGLFLNTLVLRTYPQGEQSFVDYLGQVKATSLSAFEHQELPLEMIVAELQPGRDLSRNPFFQVMFVHSEDDSFDGRLGDLDADIVPVEPGVSKFDLTFFTERTGDALEVIAEFNTEIFEQETVSAILDAYVKLLESVTADPKCRLDQLPLVHGAQYDVELVGAPADAGRYATWLQSFEDRVAERPDEAALVDGDEVISYSELDRRASSIATALTAQGVERGEFVGVYLERCVTQIAAILGVMRSGAAYVPLDPSYPSARIASVVQELARASETVRIIAPRERCSELPAGVEALTVEDALATEPGEQARPPGPDDPAYAIFTSGSTGTPKGVVVSHTNLAHSNGARDEYYDSPPQRFLLLSSFSFDSSVAGIFWTLGSGGTLLLGRPGFERDPREVANFARTHEATHTLMLPSLYDLVLQSAPPGALDSLRTVIVAGEACPVELVRRHTRVLPETKLFNEYGPTEASVWSTVYAVNGRESEYVPIGRPIPGMRTAVLDKQLQPVPPGAAGELCVSGPGVTRGYLGRPELTAENFVSISGRTVYRTGDRARLTDGQLRYLGRTDEQIKLRGYRIEPGEIVAAIREHPDVSDAAVILNGDAAGKLIAYLETGGEVDVEALRGQLRAVLPDYMVPAAFVMLESLPRMPNGKIDKSRLPEPDARATPIRPEAGPVGGTLRQVLEIWRRVLGVDVGPHDDFFESGGHSLLGVSLVMSVERELGVELPLSSLFEAPTPAGLAERVRSSREQSGFHYLMPINPHGHKRPIFCVHGGARLLAKYLDDDQPIYLLFHDIGDRNPEHESVEKVATAYLEEVRKVQPHGPYNLYGFSYGGMLAYEMATRLRNEGESIGVFALLDPPPLIDSSLMQVQMDHKLGELKDAHSRFGFLLRELPLVAWRRVRNIWREVQWAYYRTTANGPLMYGMAAALCLAGLLVVASTGSKVPAGDWRPALMPVNIEEGSSFETKFTPGMSGSHEIELAVDRTVPQQELQSTVLAFQSPSELAIDWRVTHEDQLIAAGTASDYHYLDFKPRRGVGQLAYTLFQIPISRSDAHVRSFGFSGEFTWARGMGAFPLEQGKTYTLQVAVDRTFPDLNELNPSVNVRFNRRAFLERRTETVSRGFGGLALLFAGLLVAFIAWLRKRQAVPPKLLAHRNLKHNMRLSQRYEYQPYPGSAYLTLPERHSDIVDKTIGSWRSVIRGELKVDVIEGAREHLELIDPVHGAEVARRFARELAAADSNTAESRTLPVDPGGASAQST